MRKHAPAPTATNTDRRGTLIPTRIAAVPPWPFASYDMQFTGEWNGTDRSLFVVRSYGQPLAAFFVPSLTWVVHAAPAHMTDTAQRHVQMLMTGLYFTQKRRRSRPAVVNLPTARALRACIAAGKPPGRTDHAPDLPRPSAGA